MAYQSILNPHPIKLPETSAVAVSQQEQIAQLLASQAAIVFLLAHILAVQRGKDAPLPGHEPDRLIAEFMDKRNFWTTLNQ